jgi:hypothetical protein
MPPLAPVTSATFPARLAAKSSGVCRTSVTLANANSRVGPGAFCTARLRAAPMSRSARNGAALQKMARRSEWQGVACGLGAGLVRTIPGNPSKGSKVDRLAMFSLRVVALALLAVGWSRMEQALHADAIATTALFVPLVFIAVIFWRATAR